MKTILIGTFLVILAVILLFVIAWTCESARVKRFTLNYECLKSFINDAPIDEENYKAICCDFAEIYCTTDNEKWLVKKLWSEFMFKFDKYNKYKVKK
jgi:hypothetical protein